MIPEEDRHTNLQELERNYQEEWLPWDSDNQLPDTIEEE